MSQQGWAEGEEGLVSEGGGMGYGGEMRFFIVANVDKPQVRPALDKFMPWLEARATVVGMDGHQSQDLSEIDADAIIVLGGDGTFLGAANRLRGRQTPLMGVNFGRLGFLASFSPHEMRHSLEKLMAGALPIRNRLMIEASIIPAGVHCKMMDCADVVARRRFVATAMNDAVVTAGTPFNMVELRISADSEDGVGYFGDGVIVSTPSGSTAYNVSAGGPIINPDVDCLTITPICPHSLSFRPVVISDRSVVAVTGVRVNAGTTLFCDGQASSHLAEGERVVVRRADHDALVIENPNARGWRTLAEKLNWAVSPKLLSEAEL